MFPKLEGPPIWTSAYLDQSDGSSLVGLADVFDLDKIRVALRQLLDGSVDLKIGRPLETYHSYSTSHIAPYFLQLQEPGEPIGIPDIGQTAGARRNWDFLGIDGPETVQFGLSDLLTREGAESFLPLDVVRFCLVLDAQSGQRGQEVLLRLGGNEDVERFIERALLPDLQLKQESEIKPTCRLDFRATQDLRRSRSRSRATKAGIPLVVRCQGRP